jgi:hypothetical protein
MLNWHPVAFGLLGVGVVLFLGSFVLPMFVKGRRSSPSSALGVLPPDASIDVIVPAYLEISTVGAKLEDLRKAFQSYSGRTRAIVVAGDAGTASAANSADIVILAERAGKAAACNLGAEQSDADIVVFTDANCSITPVDWPELVRDGLNRNYDLFAGAKGESGGLESLFWRFEDRMKSVSSGRESLALAGEFIATRRRLFEPIPTNVRLDDLAMGLSYVDRGLSVGTMADIRTVEDAEGRADQWERRVRIADGLLSEAVPRVGGLMRSSVGRQLVAHKIYRVTAGCAGFWLALTALVWLQPLVGILAVAAFIYGVLGYTGRLPVSRATGLLAAGLGMQMVPMAALFRILQRLALGASSGSTGVWRKIAR